MRTRTPLVGHGTKVVWYHGVVVEIGSTTLHDDARGDHVTSTLSTTRTYVRGDVADETDFATEGTRCNDPHYGYYCTLPSGHKGTQHVGSLFSREVVAVWDRDTSGDEPATPEGTPEGTWKAGDHVQGAADSHTIAAGTVLGVDEVEGITWATFVGRYLYEDQWRLLRIHATRLVPLRDGSTPPTQEEIAAAVASFARQSQTMILSARRERDQAQNEYADFRDTVRDTAITLARRHDWCSVVDEALREMGLTPMRQELDVEVKVTATRTITVRSSALDAGSLTTDDVRDALGWTRVDNAFREQIDEASSWETTDYEIVEWEAVEE